MTSEQYAALLRQQDLDREEESWQITAEELEQMAWEYEMEEGEPEIAPPGGVSDTRFENS